MMVFTLILDVLDSEDVVSLVGVGEDSVGSCCS